MAKLAGVPEKLILRAKTILQELEAHALHQKNAPRQIVGKQATLPGLALVSSPPEPPLPHPFVQTLQAVNINTTTPLEALKLIQDWQELWKE